MPNRALTMACSDHVTNISDAQTSGLDTKSASSSTRAVHEMSDQSSIETNPIVFAAEKQIRADASELTNA